MIKLTYFAFTTLSTVGFGDLHPRGNIERLLGSVILLCGVLVTSVFMENFTQVIQRINSVDKDFDESGNFSNFLKVMEKFNGGLPYDKKLASKFTKYF